MNMCIGCNGGGWCLLLSVMWMMLVPPATGQASPGAQIGPQILDRDGDGITEMSNTTYSNCEMETYYSELLEKSTNPTSWTREDITKLLVDSHRNAVPAADLFPALIDLDPGNAINTVALVYKDDVMKSEPYGDMDSWTYEHLWPQERGATGTVAFNDVHNLRPEATRVTSIRNELLYGSCGTVEFADVCRIPAAGTATADDTATDDKVWLPPQSVRGDIARSLMYMDVRYSDTDGNTANALNLQLTDCGPFGTNKMGYLSQLLQWHEDDPPNDRERLRSQTVCTTYQGNRNPFVDYPELATSIFGLPQTIADGTRTYPSCMDIPTPAPTPTPNTCSLIDPGDILFYVVESDDPDGVGFLPLREIPAGLELYMTDNAWTGNNFLANEGVLRMVVPMGGIPAGQHFGFGTYGHSNWTWVPEEGLFSIGIAGDTVMLYCLNSDDTPRPIVAFSNNIPRGGKDKDTSTGWLPAGLNPDDYGFEQSALPESLINASIAVPHFDNYYYDGIQEGTVDDLGKAMLDTESWRGADVTNEGRSNAYSTTTTMTIATTIMTTITTLLLTASSSTTTTTV